jgi:N-methylhydantoinase A
VSGARIAIDIGGTFTDVVLEQDEQRWTAKVLTTSQRPADGFMSGVERVLADSGLAARDVAMVIHGTTLGTNALIERKGARTAFLTTAGFRDILEIGYENRFEQYDLLIEKPAPLVPRRLRFTVAERVGPGGNVILPLDTAAVAALVPMLRRLDVTSLAIGFMQGYANPVHERTARDILAAQMPDVSISLAAEVCPEIREFDRFSTACANAYIRPVIEAYLIDLENRLREAGFACPMLLMTSSGSLTSIDIAKRFPVRLVESGPAGGALLAARIAQQCGLDRILSFDMGGTTAKICFIDDGEPQTSRSFEVARIYRVAKGSGLPLRIPVIEMVEIGAGGGSIARIDGLGHLTVGPDSAGSSPGPVCYDNGGVEPTVTDADLITGRIAPDRFSAGAMTLNQEGSAQALAKLGAPLSLTPQQTGVAVAEVIEETMATAARVHAIEGARDVSTYTMIAFGGAAPLHAARLAARLDIERVIIPVGAGVGSAIGFLGAPVAMELVQSLFQVTAEFDVERTNQILDEMREQARLLIASATDDPLHERRSVLMRYTGQGHEIEVELPHRELRIDDRAGLEQRFAAAYRRLYGRTIENLQSEILSWAVRVGTLPNPPTRVPMPSNDLPQAAAAAWRNWTEPRTGTEQKIAIFDRASMNGQGAVHGPAAIVEDDTATVVPEGYVACLNAVGYIVLERKVEQ